MGIVERREREKQERRNAILDAAEVVFAEKGLHNATMEDIARQAELGKSTIYLYFKCKELLYFGLDLRGCRIQIERFREAFRKNDNGLSRVMAIGEAYFNFAFEYPVYFRAKTQAGRIDPKLTDSFADDPLSPEFQKAIYAVQKILVDAIKSGIEDGSIGKNIDPLKTAIILWSVSNGMIEVLMNRGEVIQSHQGIAPAELVEEFKRFLYKALIPHTTDNQNRPYNKSSTGKRP
jgi:TetR/AcrR family transcriptional regulator